MVHPIVLRNGGYDPAKFSGFAFGMGPQRIADAQARHRRHPPVLGERPAVPEAVLTSHAAAAGAGGKPTMSQQAEQAIRLLDGVFRQVEGHAIAVQSQELPVDTSRDAAIDRLHGVPGTPVESLGAHCRRDALPVAFRNVVALRLEHDNHGRGNSRQLRSQTDEEIHEARELCVRVGGELDTGEEVDSAASSDSITRSIPVRRAVLSGPFPC